MSGATPELVKELYDKQGGRCAICGRPETTSNRGKRISELAVDHDHRSGKIRALLCNRCNHGLGCFKDDIELVKRALTYLQAFEEQEQ